LMSCRREIAPVSILTALMQHSPTSRDRSRSSTSGCNGSGIMSFLVKIMTCARMASLSE
jgi:hypothetical protein